MLRSAATAACLLLLTPVAPAGAAKKKEEPKPKDVAETINEPRPDARRLAFETSQGTWTSVDVSPDGATIAFDLLGDLYTLPIGGGTARRLTSGPAWDSQPRYSPDGRTIAFTSDRNGIDNLWLIDADGGDARALTAEKDSYVRTPDWTPDGTALVARKENGKPAGIPPVELWLFDRRGGDGIQVTSSDSLNNASGPVASRDGRFLYYAARSRGFSYTPNLQDGLWQIVRYDRRTAEAVPITGGVGGAARPAVSPDGAHLAFVSRRDGRTVLVLRELASGAERILARGLARDEMEGFAQEDLYPGYDFTPDGAAIVIADGGRIARIDVATAARTEIPFRAAVEQSLAPTVAWQDGVERGDVRVRVLRHPVIASDGTFAVFEALGRIWRQPLAGGRAAGEPLRLTPDRPELPAREYAPSLSPDGAWVAYVSWSDTGLGQVWKVPAAGGEPVQLTRRAGHYANPIFSPDGSRLVVLRGTGLELRGRQPEEEQWLEAHLLDAGGGETAFVTTIPMGAGQVFHPIVGWLPSGDRIVFGKPVPAKKPQEEVKTDLVSVRLDGSDERAYLRLPVTSELATSPDFRWAAFTSRDTVYLAPIPNTRTGEPAEISISGGAVPVWRLSDAAGAFLGWTDGGRSVTWALAATIHRLPVERAAAFAEEQRRKAERKESDDDSKEKGEKGKKGAKEASPEEQKPELELPKSDEIAIALAVPRAAPAGSILLSGARVVTMRGDAVLEDADILVTGARIAAVGPRGTLAGTDGARRFDAAGTTVIPGLVDTHAHLHYSAYEIYPETKWEYLANLAYGVTTTYDPSAPTIDVFAQGEMVEAGRMVGPRIYSSGMVLYGGQQTDLWAKVDSLEDAERQVRRMKAYGARMIKVYQQPRRAQRLWFAEAARKHHMLLTAEGAGELATDLTMVLDGYTAFEHSLPVALGDDAVRLVAGSGTFYTPTLLVSYGGPWGELYYWQTRNPHDDAKLNRFVPHFLLDAWGRRHPWIAPDEYHFPTVATGAARIARAGGKVSLGAHGQLQGLGAHWELWAMAGENGDAMTPLEALRAATLAGAEKIGLAPDLGSIEAGKLADLVVLDADPLADIHNTEKIRWVVKNGVLYDAATMRELAPEEHEAPAQYWQR